MIRAQIVLRFCDRLSVAEVAGRASVGRPAGWRWQWRFVEGGVDGFALRRYAQARQAAPLGAATLNRPVAPLRRAARRSHQLDRPCDRQGQPGSDPGPRPYPTGAAAEAGQGRDHDPIYARPPAGQELS
jgi:hypothetical protein